MSEMLLRYLDKPFIYGGRGPESYDCYGLVMAIYHDLFGITLPDFESSADRRRQHEAVLRGCLLFEPIPFPEHGAVAAFAIHPRFVTHVGVVLHGQRFIHILQKSRVTVERLDAPEWRKRVRGYYRWRR